MLPAEPPTHKQIEAGAEPVRDLLQLLHNPDLASEDSVYNLITQRQEAFRVVIARPVVRELFHDQSLRQTLIPAFIRALRHGFVGPGEKSGIKRLTNLAQNMIEVKIPGSMSQARLIGCLEEGPTITVLRLIYKGGQSSGGFERYKHLCDGNP
jgi:hypothetical protein